AAVDRFDADLLAGHAFLVGAGIAGIGERFDAGHHARPMARHLTRFSFHVHVLFRHEDVGGLGLEVGDDDAVAARTGLHVHANVTGAEIHLAGHFAGHTAATGGTELHVGRERLGLHG